MPGEVRSGNGDVDGGGLSSSPGRRSLQVRISPCMSSKVSKGAAVQETSLRSANVEK